MAYDIVEAESSGPYNHAIVLTKSDVADCAHVTRAVYIGAGGNMAVITAGGQTVTFVGVVAGSTIPIRITRLMNTNTTAATLLGLY